MLAQKALDPFVEREPIGGRQGFPVALKFYLKGAIQHQTLSTSGQVMHERDREPSLSRRKTTFAFLFRSNDMNGRLKPRYGERRVPMRAGHPPHCAPYVDDARGAQSTDAARDARLQPDYQ